MSAAGIGFSVYLMLSLIDELTAYQLLFSNNGTDAVNLSCDWEKSGLLDMNKTELSSFIQTSSNYVLVQLLIVFVIYIVCLFIANTLLVMGSAKLLKNIRIGFVSELLSKPMQWYDVHSPSELSFHVTE